MNEKVILKTYSNWLRFQNILALDIFRLLFSENNFTEIFLPFTFK